MDCINYIRWIFNDTFVFSLLSGEKEVENDDDEERQRVGERGRERERGTGIFKETRRGEIIKNDKSTKRKGRT